MQNAENWQQVICGIFLRNHSTFYLPSIIQISHFDDITDGYAPLIVWPVFMLYVFCVVLLTIFIL